MPDKSENYEPDPQDMKNDDHHDFPEGPPGPPGMGPPDAFTPSEDIPRERLVNPEIPPEPIPEKNISSTIEADVVIVGAGIAGLSAARAASEAGNVLDRDHNGIEGLYAAENTMGGRFLVDYPVVTAGASHCFALTYGRLVGTTVARLA